MSKPASSKRPKPVDLGAITARAVKRKTKDGKEFYARPDGRSYWQARRRDDRATAWTGWATREELIVTLGGLVAKGLPDSRRSAAPVRTVGELLDGWMERVEGRPDLKPKTIDHYRKGARHIVAWLRDVLVTKFDLDSADEYHRGRSAEGASPRLMYQEFLIFKMAWKWGVKRDRIPARDFPEVKVKVDPSEFVISHHTPRPEEVAEVLDQLEGEWRLAVELLATTGARVGEVCALRRRDLDTSA